jgi:hypothetical protein
VAARKNTLDVIVIDHLAPALESQGFTRDRLTFRRYSDNGDAVLVGVQRSSSSRKEWASFYINICLVPLPWLKWLRQSDDPADLHNPRDSEGVVSGRARSAASGAWLPDNWESTIEEAPERGRVAAAATIEAVQAFLPLLDRAEFLRRLEEKADLPGVCPREATRAILYLDAARFDDARRDIDAIARLQPESAFVTWVRARLPH